MHAPSADTAKPWSAPKTSLRPISAPPPRASPPSSSCGSTRTPLPRRRRFRRSARRRSSQGNEIRVVLVGALELEEIVIAAARAVRVLPADRRARFVHGAAALVLIEQHAGRLEHLVLAVT